MMASPAAAGSDGLLQGIALQRAPDGRRRAL